MKSKGRSTSPLFAVKWVFGQEVGGGEELHPGCVAEVKGESLTVKMKIKAIGYALQVQGEPQSRVGEERTKGGHKPGKEVGSREKEKAPDEKVRLVEVNGGS